MLVKDTRVKKAEHTDPMQAMFNALDELNKYLFTLCLKDTDKAETYGIAYEAAMVRAEIDRLRLSEFKYSDLDIVWLVDALNQCALDVETMNDCEE